MSQNLPYIVYGTILDSNNSVVQNTRTTARNDTSGETINVTTNSSGQYVLDLANLSSGYLNTDRITIICAFGLEYAESNFLISADTHQVNITLATVADSSDITYCTIQDVLDELGDKTTSDISYNRVRKIVLRAEAEIEERANTKFKSTTVTNEIYDFNQYTTWKSPDQLLGHQTDILVGSRNDSMNSFFNDRIRLTKTPVLSITSLSKNSAGKSASDSWETLTQNTGSGGDFLIDLDTGDVTFVNNFPAFGMRRVRVSYTYGYSTVPKTVERLCILLSVRDILVSKTSGSNFDSIDSISLEGISIRKGSGVTVSYFNWLNNEIDRLWAIIGDMTSQGA